MLARACAATAVTGYQTAGRTWWPQLHAAVLWMSGIPATAGRFPGEERSNRPAPGTAPGWGAGEGTDPQTGPSLRRTAVYRYSWMQLAQLHTLAAEASRKNKTAHTRFGSAG